MKNESDFAASNRDDCRFRSGIVSRIRLENFMCHSNLQIELGDRVNFVTGQNGSGKSAILTALCVAFGCRAKGTQRAATLKDFIKTGCSYANVVVELKNRGVEAFKPDIYGDAILIERRILESGGSTVLKNSQGKKVATRREDLLELIEHFNIDVENPCVIMSQDKSREFLHSGNDKDKFKFFFKATLLHQVRDLLKSIRDQLADAERLVDELESSIRPIEKELDDLQTMIKNVEQVEEISHQVQLLKKKLAWSWVYDVDRELKEKHAVVEQLKRRAPKVQARIEGLMGKIEGLRERLGKKKAQSASMMEKTSELTRMRNELQHRLSMATKERLELEQEHHRKKSFIQKMVNRMKLLEQQVHAIEEQHITNTQAEAHEIDTKVKELQDVLDSSHVTISRLKKEEEYLAEQLSSKTREIEDIDREISDKRKRHKEILDQIRDLQLHKTNKVTAFGGPKVTALLQAIERHHYKFKSPPIGPIGAHLSLIQGETWATAVESALGKLLNAFIVTDHNDSLLLRSCAREAYYNHLQIIIYDFSRPRLSIPSHMLPQTKHPTTLSIIQADSPTILNVLVDIGSAERQVLVKDYEVGKAVTFDQKIPNLKEVYTSEGHKMFSRGKSQTILPPNKKARATRLSGSFEVQINNLDKDASHVQEQAQQTMERKRKLELVTQDLKVELQGAKRRRMGAEREATSNKLELQDMQNSYATESSTHVSSADELRQEITKLQEDIQGKEVALEEVQVQTEVAETKANELRTSFENLCESAKVDMRACDEAANELSLIEKDLHSAEIEKRHYEELKSTKVLPEIKTAEEEYVELENKRVESHRKASIICPESEIEALEGCDGNNPVKLSALLTRLSQRLQQESERCSESIEDLRMLYEKKERKILRKQQTYKAFREKLKACHNALELRSDKFERNASLLKRQLTWKFNSHLGKKGISGHVKVNYEDQTLSIEVKMPQDASNNGVRDTRGLSGGERSFSTLCFALALHEMTESPFRAMDEFDVFMDAVSRKISLDTLVEFALAEGSQWIFITPHDISMVKHDINVKKQQMEAPRNE
ncbi:structural maintenance of chromosomes protein 6B [Impatiens glandulifera]|uniref:structural maintenance of chromosomes protein 6B n=1 Tax=Impatiens glandulifera TaxID=253017 RepID=UPI001FB0FE19|nr:structural maintenance of chromosomes protein 6B [Impatiens glandulifera]